MIAGFRVHALGVLGQLPHWRAGCHRGWPWPSRAPDDVVAEWSRLCCSTADSTAGLSGDVPIRMLEQRVLIAGGGERKGAGAGMGSLAYDRPPERQPGTRTGEKDGEGAELGEAPPPCPPAPRKKTGRGSGTLRGTGEGKGTARCAGRRFGTPRRACNERPERRSGLMEGKPRTLPDACAPCPQSSSSRAPWRAAHACLAPTTTYASPSEHLCSVA